MRRRRPPSGTPTSRGGGCSTPTGRAIRGPEVTDRERRPKRSPEPKQEQATEAPTEQADQLTALWERFKRVAARDARDILLIHYSPLVKFVASRVATGLPSSVDQSDLISYGMFGLIDALDKFEPDRKIKFETY